MKSSAGGHSRPQTPHKAQSFTRLDSPRSYPASRERASTLQNSAVAGIMQSDLMSSPLGEDMGRSQDDIFEKDNLVSNGHGKMQDMDELDSPHELPAGFDELPIELISLIDRYEVPHARLKQY